MEEFDLEDANRRTDWSRGEIDEMPTFPRDRSVLIHMGPLSGPVYFEDSAGNRWIVLHTVEGPMKKPFVF